MGKAFAEAYLLRAFIYVRATTLHSAVHTAGLAICGVGDAWFVCHNLVLTVSNAQLAIPELAVCGPSVTAWCSR